MLSAKWTVISFLVMIVLWGLLFGSFGFASAFMVLLCLHETGHYATARLLGMDVSLPFFTPFGALMAMRSMPKNAVDEALMAYAGPFVGTVASLGALLLGHTLQMPDVSLAAKFGFGLNLFNLVPISPLDGGRVLMVIDRRAWIPGLAIIGALIVCAHPDVITVPVLGLLAVFAYKDVKMRNVQATKDPAYFDVHIGEKVAFALGYIGLASGLILVLALS